MLDNCTSCESVTKDVNSNKGFTLAELLIVVAIIAVLVGLAIAVFSGSMEKSREAVDAANIRSQYAEVMVQAITAGSDVNIDGNEFNKIALKQSQDAWQNDSLKSSLHGLFTSVVNDSILNNAEPSAKGSAWVEYVYESGETVLHYSGSTAGTGSDPDQSELQGAAAHLTTFLNTGSNSFGPDFSWDNNWETGKNHSLGKALVSGRGNTDIKNALNAQGDSEAAARAYLKNAEKSSNPSKYNELKNDLVVTSGFDQMYSSYGSYAIYAQTEQNADSFPTNGTVKVTEFLIVEGQRRKNTNYPTNGYCIIGVREATYEMKNGKVINGYSNKVEDWTVVPVDSNSFNLN